MLFTNERMGDLKKYCFFIAINMVTIAVGQTRLDSLQTMNDERAINTFAITQNAATIAHIPLPIGGYAALAAQQTTGNFKRPMDATKITAIQVATGGFKKYKNWAYKTAIDYQKIYEQSVAWAGVANAYEGNPFIWADSSSGNWEKDHINASISVAAPIVFKKLQTGITIDYNIGSGARLTEPKPFYRQRYVSVRPGITYQLTNNQFIGLSGKIQSLQEENELGFFGNSTNNVLLYRLRGFGTFSKTPFVNGERKRKGTDMEANISYQKNWGQYELLLNAFAAQRDETITEGIAAPQATGYFTEIRFGGEAVLKKGTAAKGTQIQLSYQVNNGYADDVIFRAESASYNKYLLTLNTSIWTTTSNKSMWQLSLAPQFFFIDNTDQATLTQFTVANAGATFTLNWRKNICKNTHLQIQPYLGYYAVVDNSLINQRPNVITKQLTVPTYQFYNSNYINMGATIVVQIEQKNNKNIHQLAFNNRLQWVNDNPIFNNRNNLQLAYSILF